MAPDPQTPMTNLPPHRRLGGRYEVIQQLGAGGFGQTFIASDRHLPDHPRCVVKQLQPRFQDEASLQTARRLFDTEARVLYRLGDHDQIPRLLAHFEDEQEFYLVQELIEGTPLSQVLVPNEPWASDRVLALLLGILEGLAFVHEQQVIHRDLKPDNLICRHRDGKIVLIDFGAVKQVTQTSLASTGQTNLTVSIGTQGYMPPEQISGNPRFSSDIYAVGMIGIQALTGCHPRSLPTDPHTGELVWRDRAPQVNPALADILDRMVCYDFRDRYATATEALAALRTPPPPALDPTAWPPQSTAPPTQLLPQATPTPLPVTDPTLAIPGLATPGPAPSSPAQPSPAPAAPTVVLPQPTGEPRSRRDRLVWIGGSLVMGTIALVLLGRLLRSPTPAPQPATAPTAEPPATVTAASPASPNSPTPEPATSPTGDPVQPLLAQAEPLRQAGNVAAALPLYEQAIALAPDNPTAHWGRCYSLNRLQKFTEALSACDRALAIRPDYPEALWSKGYILEQQQQPAAALALYQQATQARPEFAAAWNNQGTALLALGRPAEAVAAFDRAIALDPTLPEAWNNRGAALWGVGKYSEALASVEQAITLNPDYRDAKQLRQQMKQRRQR